MEEDNGTVYSEMDRTEVEMTGGIEVKGGGDSARECAFYPLRLI